MLDGYYAVIFCGARDEGHRYAIKAKLVELQREHDGDVLVIHGASWGVDLDADELAKGMALARLCVPALWYKRKDYAGPYRNHQMARLEPDAVYAFKDKFRWDLEKGGTEHMVKIAHEAGIPCHVYSKGEWKEYSDA